MPVLREQALRSALAGSEADVIRLFEALVVASGSIVWWADGQGRVQAIAPDAQDSMRDWLGDGWREALHPEDAPYVSAAWEQAETDSGIVDVTYRARIGFEHRWVQVRAVRVDGMDGAPEHWVGVVRDIDEDARAAEALTRREQAYRSLLEATSSLIWRWCEKGATIEGEGWAFPPDSGRNGWLQGVHPEDRERALAEWTKATAGEAPLSMEYRARRADGEYRWCEVHAAPVRDPSGRVVEWVGNLVDVHDERVARAALQRKDRLEALGRLTAGVAHDFNNLLMVITSGAEALAEGLPPGHPLRSETKVTLHAAERGAQLVNQLLTVSRQQPLRPEALDAVRLLGTVTEFLKRTVEEDVEVVLCGPQGPLWCRADPAQLESALLNLCINARDAMPDGGRLELSARGASFSPRAAEARGVAPGRYVAIRVADNGHGMSPEALEHAFEPFFTTKPEGHGSGLGLSMAYGFVKQSGGHFSITSEEGKGATVELFLPACEATEPAADRAVAEIPGTTPRLQVLLVEDDDMVRDQVARQLQALGHEVKAVSHGDAALELLAGTEPFSLLMTDVVMPGRVNGRQLADEARLFCRNLPVLFTSGYTDDAIVRGGALGPRTGFLPKPYRRAQLAAALAAVVAEPSPLA